MSGRGSCPPSGPARAARDRGQDRLSTPQPEGAADGGAFFPRTPDGASQRLRGQHGAVKRRPPGTLKAALLELVEGLGGHIRSGEIAETTKGTVQRWTDADGEAAGVYPGVQKIRVLEAAYAAKGGEPVVTRFLAHEAGYALVRVEGRSALALQLMAALAGGEMGDVMRAIHDAMADDGALSPAEAGRIVAEADEAMSALAGVRASAARVRDGGGP